MRLTGKAAIVTGASRGIGRGIARRLAGEGARVVLVARGAEALGAAVDEINRAGGEALAMVGDVGLKADVERTLATTVQAYGSLDVVVNNAAWASPIAHFLEMTEEHWDQVIQANLKSLYLYGH